MRSVVAGIAAAFAAVKISSFIASLGGLSGAFSALGGVIASFVDAINLPLVLIVAAIGAVIAILVDLYQTSEEFRQKVSTAIEATKQIFVSLWESCVKPIFEKIAQVLKELWEKHLKQLVDKVVEVVKKLADLAVEIYNGFIAPIVAWLVDILGPVFATIINTIIQALGDLIGSVVDIVTGIISSLGGPTATCWGRQCKSGEIGSLRKQECSPHKKITCCLLITMGDF